MPGRLGLAAAVSPRLELEDWRCAFCYRSAELGWLHLASQRLVSGACLPDPWAGDSDTGRHTASRPTATQEADESYVY
jgi:hypothetical protein